MGHSIRSRPIRRTITGVSTVNIPVDRYAEDLTINIESGGSTFSVNYTNDNIIRGQANSYDVHNGSDVVAPASANFTELIASGAVDAEFRGKVQAYAIQVDVTIFVGDVIVTITQSS